MIRIYQDPDGDKIFSKSSPSDLDKTAGASLSMTGNQTEKLRKRVKELESELQTLKVSIVVISNKLQEKGIKL